MRNSGVKCPDCGELMRDMGYYFIGGGWTECPDCGYIL